MRYEKDDKFIEKVKVQEGVAGLPRVWRREEVVKGLNTSKTFCTILIKSNGNIEKGKKVELYDDQFIRTKANDNDQDNLENLPRF
ncbi:MAG: DUF3892 domain-containing protein [Balneolales bacterium]